MHKTCTRHAKFLWVPTHVLMTGIHKAFTRHSQGISQPFRTRHSQGIYKSFTSHSIATQQQTYHKSFTSHSTPGVETTFQVSEVLSVLDACVNETITCLKQHDQKITASFASSLFKNATIKKLVQSVEGLESPVKSKTLKRYGKTLSWLVTKKRSHAVGVTPKPRKRQRKRATKTKKKNAVDPATLTSELKLADLLSPVPSSRKSRRVVTSKLKKLDLTTVQVGTQHIHKTFTRHLRDIHTIGNGLRPKTHSTHMESNHGTEIQD